jgi:hypothetical protein
MATLAGVIVLAAGGYLIWAATSGGLPTSVPSCSWPLRVIGPVTGEQSGLIRCYLRALASHDAGGLLAVADTTSTPVRITSADFRHSADARAGIATATFARGEMDNAFAVTIMFADHARETLALVLANPGSLHSWRLGIGTPVGASGGPPPAKPSP